MQIRCASLIIQQARQQALAQAVKRSAWALGEKMRAVEQGSLEDHCKHASLRKSLVHLSTLLPVITPPPPSLPSIYLGYREHRLYSSDCNISLKSENLLQARGSLWCIYSLQQR